MRVIGTAGHVDHGKSTLIAALTGIHPDRLKEEQAREMTIDLGFGWLTLPGGREVGIVDVPGHRDFVQNMLAGVAGIDAVWLVVAADEGVMPQTREHLGILDLLGIRGGLLVLTKTDLVSDPAWLEAVESDVRATVRTTTLQHAPIIRVSARTGVGLPELLTRTEALLAEMPPRPNLSRPRMPLDRVFSMDGFGTVVTGTLTDGELAVGDELQILPSGLSGRVRGLQNHRRKVDRAFPGARTAVNISGIPAEALRRGEVLTHPGQYAATRRMDAHVRLLTDASTRLTHDLETKLFTGTSETMARVRLLGSDELRPGADGWIQLELQDPVVCARGDAFILRIPSPAETLGGGTVVDAHPPNRHRRFDESVLHALRGLADGTPADILLQAALSVGLAPARDIMRESRLTAEAASVALTELVASGKLVGLESGAISTEAETLLLSSRALESITQAIEQTLVDFHAKYPLRRGMPREELRHQLELAARPFQAIVGHLETGGRVVTRAGLVGLSTHAINLTPTQRDAVDALMRRFEASPSAPPTVKDCNEAVGAELFASLREQGMLVAVSAEVVFSRVDYDGMVRTLVAELGGKEQFTLAEVRNLFGTSRRYAQAFLEHLDSIGITHRIGDARVLEPGSADRHP